MNFTYNNKWDFEGFRSLNPFLSALDLFWMKFWFVLLYNINNNRLPKLLQDFLYFSFQLFSIIYLWSRFKSITPEKKF